MSARYEIRPYIFSVFLWTLRKGILDLMCYNGLCVVLDSGNSHGPEACDFGIRNHWLKNLSQSIFSWPRCSCSCFKLVSFYPGEIIPLSFGVDPMKYTFHSSF